MCTTMAQKQIVRELHENEQQILNADHLRYIHHLSAENIIEAVEFIWLQMFKEILVDMSRRISDTQRKSAFRKMLDICRNYYRNMPGTLNQIDRFEQTYTPSNAINWYTQDSFLYRIVNEALRTDDVDIINSFRFYIGDLSCSLNKHYQQATISHTLHVFRGTTMPYTHFLKLQPGLWIADNGFVSTTRSRDVAERYSGSQFYGKSTEQVSVIFDITIDNQQSQHRWLKCRKEKRSAIFADVSLMSAIPDEEEVLFDLGTIFQIVSIIFDDQKKTWFVPLCDVSIDDANRRLQSFVRDSPREAFEVLVRRTNEWTVTTYVEASINALDVLMDERFDPFSYSSEAQFPENVNICDMCKWLGRFFCCFSCKLVHSQLDSILTITAYTARIEREGIHRLAPELNQVTPSTIAKRMEHHAYNSIFTTTASHSINERTIENPANSSILGALAREIRTYYHKSKDNETVI